ncbi:MAG: hypothetical protein ACM3O6_12150 [Acidobacteriota bacterium]
MKSVAAVYAFVLLVLVACAGGREARAQADGDCSGTLTKECLPQTLKSLGLAFQPTSIGYEVTIKQGTWNFYVQIVLSSDGTKVGFNSNLGDVDEQKISAGQWMALLAANKDYDPSVFFYDAARKRLYIHRSLDNRNMTPVVLRTQIDAFLKDIRESEKAWSAVAH